MVLVAPPRRSVVARLYLADTHRRVFLNDHARRLTENTTLELSVSALRDLRHLVQSRAAARRANTTATAT